MQRRKKRNKGNILYHKYQPVDRRSPCRALAIVVGNIQHS
jgi:hypothetical protein